MKFTSANGRSGPGWLTVSVTNSAVFVREDVLDSPSLTNNNLYNHSSGMNFCKSKSLMPSTGERHCWVNVFTGDWIIYFPLVQKFSSMFWFLKFHLFVFPPFKKQQGTLAVWSATVTEPSLLVEPLGLARAC